MEIPQLVRGAQLLDQPGLETGTYEVQLPNGKRALIHRRRTKRLRALYDELLNDAADNLSALRDAALNSDNSPEEVQPPCVFRSQHALSQWLPQEFIVKASWLPIAGATTSCGVALCPEGVSQDGWDPRHTTQFPTHAANAGSDAPSGCALGSISIQCHEESSRSALRASKMAAGEMVADSEHSLDQERCYKTARPHEQGPPNGGSSPVHPAAVPKKPAALSARFEISEDDEKLLESSEQRVSKFSAHCTVEPWLSRHCSMFGIDYVKRAIHKRLERLRPQTT
eukprot:jgi/Ulvmu1/7283/UM035_0071.1